MGRRISRWAGMLAMAAIVAACTGCDRLVRAARAVRVTRRPGGTCLSPARDDDPGDPADRPVRRAADGHDHRRQRGRRRRTADHDLPRSAPAEPPGSADHRRRLREDRGTRPGARHVHRERQLRAARCHARRLARADRDRGRWRPPRPDRRSVTGHRLRHDTVRPGARHARGVRRVLGVALRPDLARRRPRPGGAVRRRIRTRCSSASSRSTIRPSGRRLAIWPLEHTDRDAGQAGRRPPGRPAAGRSAAPTPRPSDRASRLRTS